MTESCVSELFVDQLVTGELSPEVAAQTRAHAASCASCGQLVAEAEAVAQRFAADPPPLRLPPRRRRRYAVLGAAAVAAAAFAIALVPARERANGVRVKGPASLGAFVSHAGAMRRAQPGEVVAPGDVVQLVTTSEGDGWIAVTGTEGSAARTVYAAPQPLTAGRDRTLPFSIVIDDTLGPTTITAVFCKTQFTLERIPEPCTRDELTLETRR